MIDLASLWLPILLSTGLVFVASAILHMLPGYHTNDFRPVPQEETVMVGLREAGIPPGDYALPYAGSSEEMRSEAYVEKAEQGPVALLTVRPSGPPSMGQSLFLWFVFCFVASLFAAYLTGRALGPGAPYLEVFRFAGTTAFAVYAVALWQDSIWYGRAWTTTLKNTLDGLVYALLTAGVFGWLWPG